ncbi:aspartyl-phosphate phosphatase Spo0E family protein [Alicyclobacillus fastidiosus]|uniref:Aspartyl-phosphate phosphatase Spo0E family protein n=1 Tax=Alicyclobacillus fastidiosus TaxID=392011 RepID=A0ABV5AK99_9BACL|nr:aspartyl-phosphate phosphatase Spo0E family protein [Alicyclobacillus fastidiosus]WEH08251.1 aspartyl-phosphate phosphatase Spo0E family protein [Alicyclobacillus fastidiosus]
MTETTIRDNIELLRTQMVRVAEEQGSLTHPDVLAISERLDVLICEAQAERFHSYRTNMKKRTMVRPLWASFYRYKSRIERLARMYM